MTEQTQPEEVVDISKNDETLLPVSLSESWAEIPILLSLVGFILSILCVILPWNCHQTSTKTADTNKKEPSAFREISLSVNGLPVKTFIISVKKKRLATYSEVYDRTSKTLIKMGKVTPDSPQAVLYNLVKDSMQRSKNLMVVTEQNLFDLQYTNELESPASLLKYYYIEQPVLDSILTGMDSVSTFQIHLIDSSSLILGASKPDSIVIVKIKSKRAATTMKFVSRYSGFGLWLFISCAQMTIWFLLAALVFAKAAAFNAFATNRFAWKLLISISVVSLFCLTFFKFLTDDLVVRDSFFLQQFSFRMYVYAFPGYLLVGICFAIFLFSADLFNSQKKGGLMREELINVVDNKNLKSDKYQEIESLFDAAFVSCSIVLSVFVLWCGVLFYSINSTDIMKIYEQISGRPFLNPDLVYLIGLFHTLLLIIFYIPVRLKFISLRVVKDVAQGEQFKQINIAGILSEFLPKILVTASPVLMSLFQNIFSKLFGE